MSMLLAPVLTLQHGECKGPWPGERPAEQLTIIYSLSPPPEGVVAVLVTVEGFNEQL